MSPFEAARIIHKAGGIAVLAHPAEIENLSYVEEILHSGVMDGMEVFHPSVLQEKNKHDWLAIAKKVSSHGQRRKRPTWQSGAVSHALRGISIPYDAVSEIVTYSKQGECKMKVITFTGPSGTGKSFRAISVAHQHGCDGIIDDGLLIEAQRF